MNRIAVLAGILFAALITAGVASAGDAIATVQLNQRAGPGTSFQVLQVIPPRQPLRIIGCNASGAWCDVEYFGVRGWVAARYLALNRGRISSYDYRTRGTSVGIGFSSPGGVGIGFSTGSGYYRPYHPYW